jgi:hypothetical protein
MVTIFGETFDRDDVESILRLAAGNLCYCTLKLKVQKALDAICREKTAELRAHPNYRPPIVSED